MLKWMTEMDERLIDLEKALEAVLTRQEMAIKAAEAAGAAEWYGWSNVSNNTDETTHGSKCRYAHLAGI